MIGSIQCSVFSKDQPRRVRQLNTERHRKHSRPKAFPAAKRSARFLGFLRTRNWPNAGAFGQLLQEKGFAAGADVEVVVRDHILNFECSEALSANRLIPSGGILRSIREMLAVPERQRGDP